MRLKGMRKVWDSKVCEEIQIGKVEIWRDILKFEEEMNEIKEFKWGKILNWEYIWRFGEEIIWINLHGWVKQPGRKNHANTQTFLLIIVMYLWFTWLICTSFTIKISPLKNLEHFRVLKYKKYHGEGIY